MLEPNVVPAIDPVSDTPEHLAMQQSIIDRDACIHVYPYAAITVGQKGEALADLEGMAGNCIAFSDDGHGVQSEEMMRAAMIKAKSLGKIITAHCEVNSLLHGGYIHDGKYAADNGHRGICPESEWKQIVVSTDDTERNIDIALKLYRTFDNIGLYHTRPQIVVVFHHSFAGAQNLFAKYKNIVVVDVKSQLNNYEALIGRSSDVNAKKANRRYNLLSSNTTIWNKIGTFLEASNRAQALDILVKKKLFNKSKASQNQTMEFLAMYEHNRWMAFSFAHGWMPMSENELTAEERKAYKTKHPEEKRHICLVPWDELDSLPQKAPGQLKSYDWDTVKQALSDESNI